MTSTTRAARPCYGHPHYDSRPIPSLSDVFTKFGLGDAARGRAWLSRLFAGDTPEAAARHCDSRETGCWDANDLEGLAAWHELAKYIRAEGLSIVGVV